MDEPINLNKIKERKGKNYHWSTIVYKNVTLLIRRYGNHLTIFTKTDKTDNDYNRTEYGAFTFYVEFDKIKEENERDRMADLYYDKPFTELNFIIKDLFKLLIDKDYGTHWVSNSACLSVSNYIEIKLAFNDKQISSIDRFVFCLEELDTIYLELFAENIMLKKLKDFKTGDKLDDRYTIGEIKTEVKDKYYYSAGMELIDTKNNDKKSFADVYVLSRWHFDDVFSGKKIHSYNGEIYVEGGKFKVGEPVAHKNEEFGTTLFKETCIKEHFIPLVKF